MEKARESAHQSEVDIAVVLGYVPPLTYIERVRCEEEE